MTDKMIIVTEIDDEDRNSTVWHTLANECPDLTTDHCCEIDTSTWDEGAWRDWEQRESMIEEALDLDEDTVIIWYLKDGELERRAFGMRS